MEERDLSTDNPADPANAPMRPNERDEYDPVEDMADVRQDEDPEGPTVPVCVKETVRTKELPSRLGGLLSKVVPDRTAAGARPVKLLDADPRRRRAYIEIPPTETLWLGPTAAQANSDYAFELHSILDGPGKMDVYSCDEVWGIGRDAEFKVSVLNEQWAE